MGFKGRQKAALVPHSAFRRPLNRSVEAVEKGTFEYILSYLIDRELELSIFYRRFKNDETGAPAYIRVFC